MDLSDALGDWPSGGNQSAGGPWPGNTNPTWPGNPGQPPSNPTWPSGQSGGGGMWGDGNNKNPTWPAPSQPPAGPGGWPAPSQPPAGPGGWPAPSQHPTGPGGWPAPTPAAGPGFPSAPQQNLTVPYNQKLPNGVFDKLLITIVGTIKPSAQKITLDLSTDRDLAFHFNPRFNEMGKKVIVRNSCIGKSWGQEERTLSQFPFFPGKKFEMKILCTSREFKVAVNNSHLLAFNHRVTDLRSITKLSIYNDLSLESVNIETVP